MSATARTAILVLNAGSSSIKFALYVEEDGTLRADCHGQMEGLGGNARFIVNDATGAATSDTPFATGAAATHEAALDRLLEFISAHAAAGQLAIGAVGHRIVHGGQHYAAPVRIDATVLEALTALVPLAPLHQPHNLRPVRHLLRLMPDLAQVGCFDTAFHRTNSDLARRYALPEALHAAGLQRYGFHGLSYEYVASVLPRFDARAATGRTIVLHLGNGASMCALEDGRSIATTMGFTALEGLPMGTRCGALDPGVVLHLMTERHLSAAEIETLLYRESGLLGVSGISSDMRCLLASDSESARRAVDLFVYRIARELGSLAAALGGLDAVVFTAGIGEHAAAVRAGVGRLAQWLGLEIDAAANSTHGPRISASHSRVAAWVIPTDEEWMIATHARQLTARGLDTAPAPR